MAKLELQKKKWQNKIIYINFIEKRPELYNNLSKLMSIHFNLL